MSNWTPEEVEARERIMKQQTARDLAGALSALAEPEARGVRRSIAETLSASFSPAKPLGLTSPVVLKKDTVLPAVRASGRIRQPKGMNRTEARYSAHLELQRRAGSVAWFKYEGITLKLAHDCRLTLDFAVMTNTGALELHDVKASWNKRTAHVEDDALAKMRVASEMFPFRVLIVWPGKSGEWDSREF